MEDLAVHLPDDEREGGSGRAQTSAAVDDQDMSPPRGEPFVVVGVGGSAGGLQAFTDLLKALPVDTGMAYVFVQHLDPYYESQLTEILSGATALPVHTVTDRMRVSPN